MQNSSSYVWISIIIICLSGLIINFLKRTPNKSFKTRSKDETLLYFRIFVPLGLVASSLYYSYSNILNFYSNTAFYIGLFLLPLGLLLRWWSILILGSRFTVNVSIINKHKIEKNGPYKYIRHPSYTALLVYYIALGLIMQNFFCIALLTLMSLIPVLLRIYKEEQILIEHFGNEYVNYQLETWRLIPWVY